MFRSLILATGLTLAALPVAPTIASAQTQAVHGDQARDHAAILAMAGAFKVTFDMRETTPLVAGYTPYPAKLSGGHEVVRAIVDTPDHVVLQHLLVVTDGNAKTMVIKHWRQDWTWQPSTVLVYTAAGRWTLRQLAEAERRGAWSQTVWQTDDSPRYGGIGRWRYDDGATRWTSDETRRPLARRDATRSPPYDHYIGSNRHILTPAGWVHEQDNAKIGLKDGKPATYVHEYVINTYTPATDFAVTAADAYWAKTKDYWAAVRTDWDRAITKGSGLRVKEDASNGSTTGHQLMLLADDMAAGETDQKAAEADAENLIRRESGTS